MKKIILASGSPRRKMLLQWAELEFDVMVSDVDETPDLSLSPEEVALDIARRKNRAVFSACPSTFDGVVIAADTIVVLDQEVIGKPADEKEAIHILKKLSGQRHSVVTGVCMADADKLISFSDTTHVTFHHLTDAQIEHYVQRYQPYDKAGAYAIQEWIGVVGIQSIEGDFYNVMGLPVSLVLQHLHRSFL